MGALRRARNGYARRLFNCRIPLLTWLEADVAEDGAAPAKAVADAGHALDSLHWTHWTWRSQLPYATDTTIPVPKCRWVLS